MLSKSGCVECGSPVYFDEFEPVTTCPSCGTAFRLPRDSSGSYILTYSFGVPEDIVHTRAAGIIEHRLLPGRRPNYFEIVETFPVYLPIWNITARASGWIISGGKGGEEVRPVELVRRYRIPAYDNVQYIGQPVIVSGSDALISPERYFPSLPLSIKPVDVERKARDMLAEELDSTYGPHEGRGKTSVTVINQTLVVYPAWIVRFRTKRGEHALTLDGINGEPMNDPEIQKGNEDTFVDTLIATSCAGVTAAGAMLISFGGLHGPGLGLLTSGAAVFLVVNGLRHALRAPRHSYATRPRKVTV
ncbi:MAG: hypothetical protein J9259_01360 [Thermoplasmata archaeon YP2-bin.285]|uniref:Uncharacterized protein n=1 Tax=Candidatus Sysuiplasma superficiale TaxID=2823368 RepID=A0A8J7YM83_9ARCH|nr:hypothetical protein [Candidatus Sysuiplasma superficiale]